MAKKQRSGKSYKDQYSKYKAKSSCAVNWERNIERHCKKFPEDAQALKVLKRGYTKYRRRKPMHRGSNKGVPVYDKKQDKIVRIVFQKDLFPNKSPKKVLTTAEQFHELGLAQLSQSILDRISAGKFTKKFSTKTTTTGRW